MWDQEKQLSLQIYASSFQNPNRQNEIESDIKIYAIYNEILIEKSISPRQ